MLFVESRPQGANLGEYLRVLMGRLRGPGKGLLEHGPERIEIMGKIKDHHSLAGGAGGLDAISERISVPVIIRDA